MNSRRPKKKNSLAKFIVIIVLILAVLVAIFYAIDNPKIFNRIKGFFLQEDEESQEEAILEEQLVEQPEIEEEIPEENPEEEEKEGWWNRILGIIKPDEEETQTTSYPSQLEINLYFMGLGQDQLLVPEVTYIIAGDAKTAVINATRKLLEGPKKEYHISVIPGGTRLLGVEVYENLAKLDLSQEFLENSLDSNIFDRQIIYSIVNTLTEIPSIEGVIFHIDGKRIKVYGNVDLSIPAIRDESLIISENEPQDPDEENN